MTTDFELEYEIDLFLEERHYPSYDLGLDEKVELVASWLDLSGYPSSSLIDEELRSVVRYELSVISEGDCS